MHGQHTFNHCHYCGCSTLWERLSRETFCCNYCGGKHTITKREERISAISKADQLQNEVDALFGK